MFPAEADALLTLAEIAIAMAGFSAIVVLFRRSSSGTWLGTDADRFNGMIVHSVAAAAFCLLPAAIGVFTRDAALLWRLASALLALQILGHAGVVVFHLKRAGPVSSVFVGAGGLAVAALLGMNAFGLYFQAEPGPFVIGVLWHLLQAGVLFTWLIWVGESSIER